MTTSTETTTYKLRQQGVYTSEYTTAEAAIDAAGEDDEVYMLVVSGSQKSLTRVWPRVGETRTWA